MKGHRLFIIIIPTLVRPSRLTRPCFKHFTNVNSLSPHDNPMSYTLALASFYRGRDWGKEKNCMMSGSTTFDKVPDRSLLKHMEVGWEGGPGKFTPSPIVPSLWPSSLPGPPIPLFHLTALLLFTLHSHPLRHKEVCFSLLGLLFFPATPLLEKTLISWQLGNAVDPRKRDLFVLWGSLEESGSSKFPTQLRKTQSSQAGPPGECDPKGDSKKKGKTEGREPLSIHHEAPVRPSVTPWGQFASVPQNLSAGFISKDKDS